MMLLVPALSSLLTASGVEGALISSIVSGHVRGFRTSGLYTRMGGPFQASGRRDAESARPPNDSAWSRRPPTARARLTGVYRPLAGNWSEDTAESRMVQ